jgi:hypothetical protein
VKNPSLREGLLGAESPSAELEARYRERLRALTERRVAGVARAAHVVGLLIALALLVRFLQLFAGTRAGARPESIAGLAVGLAFSVGWALAEGAVLRAGAERFFSHGAVRTLLVVVFTFLLAGLMLWAGIASPDAARGTRLILFGLVFWCAIGLPFLLAYLIRGSEVRVRIALLEMELARTDAPEVRP